MMKKILIALTALCVLASCENFVDVVPKGNTIPETVDDLGRLMTNGSISTDWNFTAISYCVNFFEAYSDDYAPSENPASAMYMAHKTMPLFQNVLQWKDYLYALSESDYNWDGLYKSNYVANYVLANIDVVGDGVAYQRDEVKGQALVHRAMNYFLLVNLYGKQYNKTTSPTDLGVPLVLEADVNKQHERATVDRVYGQIMQDLNEAVALLKVDVPKYNNVPGRATAYALRARVRLWMLDYDGAYNDASEALKLRNELIDYNTCALYVPGVPAYGVNGYDNNVQTNPEIMYSRYRTEGSTLSFSDKMLAIIDEEHDLRFQLFYGSLMASNLIDPRSWVRFNHAGINTSEVWLVKAEAALQKTAPDVAAAIEALDYVRDRRYKDGVYEKAPADRQLLLEEILKERRREITFTEMSFLDRKRQNVAYPESARGMSRTVYGESYELPLGSPRWQLAIPLNVMELNGLLIQNER